MPVGGWTLLTAEDNARKVTLQLGSRFKAFLTF